MHDCPRGDRSLLPTTRAFIGIKLCLQLPGFAGFASGTNKSLRPAHGKKIAGTRSVVRKPGAKRRPRHRFVCLPPAFHIGTKAEHNAPCQANLPQILQEIVGGSIYRSQREEPSQNPFSLRRQRRKQNLWRPARYRKRSVRRAPKSPKRAYCSIQTRSSGFLWQNSWNLRHYLQSRKRRWPIAFTFLRSLAARRRLR